MKAQLSQPTINSTSTIQRPEILAPAGNWECAKAAVENGADAIYFGLDKFNARMRAENFTEADLPELMEFLHSRGVKGYVTLNTLVFPQELRQAQQYLRSIIAAGVDAVIAQDIGICRLIRHLSPDFPIHASTQMSITSSVGVEFAESLGCNLVVLARECSLQEIDKIQRQLHNRSISLPLEVFVHGALCVAYSGQCLTSEALGGRSANRGECAQACRMPYELISDGEVINLGDKKYLLSPQDLAGLDVLPDLVKSGVACLKIEGRLKSPEYVANVTRVYRQALDGLMEVLDKTNSSNSEVSTDNLGTEIQENQFNQEFNSQNQQVSPENQDVILQNQEFKEIKTSEEIKVSKKIKQSQEIKLSKKNKASQEIKLTQEIKVSQKIKPSQEIKLNQEIKPSQEIENSWGRDNQNYELEMAFSRGIYTGWLRGINNQELVHARFGKKRGVYLGEVIRINQDQITIQLENHLKVNLKAGDGVVFDNGHPEGKEEGGRIYTIKERGKEAILTFGRDSLNLRKIFLGDKVWKTSDPELDKQLRQTFSSDVPQFQRPIDIGVYGEKGQTMRAIARDELGNIVQLDSSMVLEEAHSRPLTSDRLEEQLGRLGNTALCLGSLTNNLKGNVIIPVSELNRMRRDIVSQLEKLRAKPKAWELRVKASYEDLLPPPEKFQLHELSATSSSQIPSLIVLVRNLQQLETALEEEIETIYCEFEDPRKYRKAVEMVKAKREKEKNLSFAPYQSIWVAPPRITKPGENWILDQVRSCDADGYLIRNYDHLKYFRDLRGDRCIGDFSLNIANPLTADYFKNQYGLERLTASYDLNITQLEDLIKTSPPHWYEVTIHQHMPMFHMEHCVFCAFLSKGKDFRDCGYPCEKHEVKIRDRVGTEHILLADTGCRNTVFNGTAQTGAEYVLRLIELGLSKFRIEFVNETPEEVRKTINLYQQLLEGEITGSQLWRELKLQNQLGVTRGAVLH